jgi:hypothetical protein
VTNAPIRGIDRPEGFKRRDPIGCALTMGRKGPNNAPVDKHRFFIVRPVADGSGKDARRATHPSYTDFNKLAASIVPPADLDPDKRDAWLAAARAAHDEKRATVRGYIVHENPEDCWSNRRQADRLDGHVHPKLGPSCMGNGRIADRWMPGKNAYIRIACPGRQCEFATAPKGKRPPCHPHTKLIFQLRFDNAPSALCKFTSNGWETTDAIEGFFVAIEEQARMLGVQRPSFYAIPFALTISKRSNPAERTSWTVVHMTPDFPPGLTLQDYLIRQADTRRQIATAAPLLAIGMAATLDDDRDNEGDDARALRPDTVPTVEAEIVGGPSLNVPARS